MPSWRNRTVNTFAIYCQKCIVLLSTKEAKKTGSDEQSGLKRKHNLDTRFNEKCQNSENKVSIIFNKNKDASPPLPDHGH